MTTTTDSMYDELLAIIIDAGFDPADGFDDTEVSADLKWIADYGFDAYRTEDGHVTLVRARENDGIKLVRSTRNYVITSEARFDWTPTGFNWFKAAVLS